MLGQAVGVHREFSGVMSKPWRMVVLHAGAWAALAASWSAAVAPAIGGLTILDWACLVVVVGCLETIGVRLRRIMQALERERAR